MDDSRQRIQKHLQDKDVQARIYDDIQRGRLEATVTIGRVAQLFTISESKLREMEAIGLLNPLRKEGKDSRGQRQYPLEELDKLAIIKELVNAKYTLVEIPKDIEGLWSALSSQNATTDREEGIAHDPIDQRIDAEKSIDSEKSLLFWRYYASQVLRLSLMLVRESLPGATIGLLLPLHGPVSAVLPGPENMAGLGESLVSWLTRDGSSHTLYTANPSFQYPTDYCIYPLTVMRDEVPVEEPEDGTLLILERPSPSKRSQALTLTEPFVKLIRRLLAPLYQEKQMMQVCFGAGMRDERISATDLNAMIGFQDSILDGLANMIIRLGGQTANRQNRWRFCQLLLPDMLISGLPLQQRSLITRAQSKESNYILGESIFSPGKSKTSVGIRAFQSGRIIYRPELSRKDRTQVFLDIEGPIRSNIAIPVGAENGQPVAVIYVASDEPTAFSREDQQLLRIMSRLIENLLMTYQTRLQTTADLKSLMRTPDVVDTLFAEFLSENNFMRDVEDLLSTLHVWLNERGESRKQVVAQSDEQQATSCVSFIALDIDNQEMLASQYGDEIMRYLNKTIGLRIQELIAPLITKSTNCQLYYIYADRFYLILRGIPLEKAREKAEQFRASLEGSISIKRSEASESLLILPNISIHLAVLSYTREKLEEFLQSYSSVSEIGAMINQTLDVVLKLGTEEGDNVVMTWDRDYGGTGGFRRWSPLEL